MSNLEEETFGPHDYPNSRRRRARVSRRRAVAGKPIKAVIGLVWTASVLFGAYAYPAPGSTLASTGGALIEDARYTIRETVHRIAAAISPDAAVEPAGTVRLASASAASIGDAAFTFFRSLFSRYLPETRVEYAAAPPSEHVEPAAAPRPIEETTGIQEPAATDAPRVVERVIERQTPVTYITNPTTVVSETIHTSGGGKDIDTSPFVARSLFDAQVDAFYNSLMSSTDGLGESFGTELLTVSVNASIGGTLAVAQPTTLATTSISSLSLAAPLAISSGGIGATSLSDLITLGGHTTGNYVATLAGNSQITVTGSGSETAAATLAVAGDSIGDAQLAFDTGQHLTTTSAVTFATTSLTALTIGGDIITDVVGAGLALSGSTLTTTLGATVAANELAVGDFGDFTCNGTDCSIDTDVLGTDQIQDVYLLNTGDAISGNLSLSGSSANIALGSNYLSGDGDDEGIYVSSAGDIGIGTTNPGQKLTVTPTGTTDGITISRSGTGSTDGSYWAVHVANSSASDAMAIGYSSSAYAAGGIVEWLGNSNAFLYYPGTGDFRIGTGVGTTPTMTFDGSGNVGINATNPTSRFEIRGASGSNGGALMITDSGNTANYRQIFLTNNDSSMSFYNGNNTAFLSNAGAWVNASDVRIKKHISDLSKYGLDTVLAMRPVQYNTKSNGEAQVGFIAQEMQQLVPEVVIDVGDVNHMLGVNYGNLVAIDVKAIQELNLNLEVIASTTAISTPKSQTFAQSFFRSLFARITTWLADTGNGIADLFATTIHASNVEADDVTARGQIDSPKLCLGSTCVTEAELRLVLERASLPATSSAGAEALPREADPAPDPKANGTDDQAASGQDVSAELPVITDAPPLAPEHEATNPSLGDQGQSDEPSPPEPHDRTVTPAANEVPAK